MQQHKIILTLVVLWFTISAEKLTVETYLPQNASGSQHPLRVTFSEQMIPFGFPEDSVPEGLFLDPSVAGKWSWYSQSTLQFVPDLHWKEGVRYIVTVPGSIESKVSGHQLKKTFTKIITFGYFTGNFTSNDSLILTTDSVNVWFSLPVHPDSLRNHLSNSKQLEITATSSMTYTISSKNGWSSGKRITLCIDSGLTPLGGNVPLDSKLTKLFVASDSLICLGLFRNGSKVSAQDSLFFEDKYEIKFNRQLHGRAIPDYFFVNGTPFDRWVSGSELFINHFFDSSSICTLSFNAGMPSNDSAFLFKDIRFVLAGAYNRIDPLMPSFSIEGISVQYAPSDSLQPVKLSEKKPVVVTPDMRFDFAVSVKDTSNKRIAGIILVCTSEGVDTLGGRKDSLLYVNSFYLPANAPCTLIAKSGFRYGKYQLKNDYVVHFTTSKMKLRDTCRTVVNIWDGNRSCQSYQNPPRIALLPQKPAIPLEVFGKQKIITAIRNVPVSELLLSYDSTRFLPHQWHLDTMADIKSSQEFYSYIPVPLTPVLSNQERGSVEVLLSKNNSRFDTLGLFNVTDLAVETFNGRLVTAASVSSLTKKTPLAGASVSFIGKDKNILSSGKTDSLGLFKTHCQLDADFVLASFETDTMVQDCIESSYYGRRVANKGVVFTERTIYRPGDTLFFKGILRTLSDQWTPLQNDTVVVSIVWEGAPFFVDTLPVTGLGSFWGKLVIPENVKQKSYSFTVNTFHTKCNFESSYFSIKDFRVSEIRGKVGTGRIEKDSVAFPLSAQWLHGGTAQKCPVTVKWHMTRYEFNGSEGLTFRRSKSHQFSYTDSSTAILDSLGCVTVSHSRLHDDSGALYSLTASITGSSVQSATVTGYLYIPVSNQPCIGFQFMQDEQYKGHDSLFVKTMLEDGSAAPEKTVDILFFREDEKKRKVRNRYGLPAVIRDTVKTITMKKRITTDTNGIHIIPISSLNPGNYGISSIVSGVTLSDSFTYEFTIYEPARRTDSYSEDADYSSEKSCSLSIINNHIYNIGDTVLIHLHADIDSCTAVLSVRRENLYEHRWVRMAGKDTNVTFVVKDAYIPAVRIEAVFLQPLRRDTNGFAFNQPQGYKTATVTLDVSDSSRAIPVCVSTDSTAYSPGDSVTVYVSVPPKFISATALVMVVDEGILKVTNTTLPSIKSVFTINKYDCDYFSNMFSFECFHGPFNYDSCNALKLKPKWLGRRGVSGIGYGAGYGSGFGGEGIGGIDELIGGLMGGDGAGLDMKRSRRTTSIRDRILPCACFKPDVTFDKYGHASCRFKLPGNLTRWRITAIVDDTTSFGSDTTSIIANKPLMVRPQLPRFLRMGDSASIQYIIENRTEHTMMVNSGVLTSRDTMVDSCQIYSNSTRFCNIPLIGRTCGIDSLLFIAGGGSFSDGIKTGTPVIDEKIRTVQAIGGSTIDGIHIPMVLPKSTTSVNCSLALALSTTRMQNLNEGVRYLFEYPYGCLEQQGAKVMPLLCLKSFTEQFNLPMLKNGDEQKVIQTYLNNVGLYQNSKDGGLTYWPSDSGYSYPWLTAFVLEIMIEAQQQGYKIDTNVFSRAMNYLKLLRNPTANDKQNLVTDCYLQLISAKAGETNWNELKHLYQMRNKLPLTARINLMKAIHISGKNRRFVSVLQKSLQQRLIEKDRLAYFSPEESSGLEFCHESSVRQTALSLEALLETGCRSRFDEPMVRWLSDQRQAARWRTTQENMAVFRAYAAYTKVYEKEEPDITAAVKLAGTDWFTTILQGREGVHSYNSRTLESIKARSTTTVDINSEGSGRLYYDLFLLKSDTGNVPPLSSGLTIQRTVIPVSGYDQVMFDTSEFQIGKLMQVELNIRCDQNITFVAIDDPVPAGCEAVDPTLVSGEQSIAQQVTSCTGPQSHSHREFRDSRVIHFFNDMPEGVYKIKYLLKPTTSGRFLWPAPKAEAMYYPEISGRGSVRSIVVSQP